MIDKDALKCNKPQRTPNHPKASHVVKACTNGQEKIIRFGQQGVSGSPKKEGESESYRKRRESFKARHAKNIAKGPSSAAYWANKVKWAEGGEVNLRDLLAKYAEATKEGFGERPLGFSPEVKQQLEAPTPIGLFNKYLVSPAVAAGDAALRSVPAAFSGLGSVAGSAYDQLAPKLPDVVRRNLGTGDQLARDIAAFPDALIPELRVFAPAAQSARASAAYGATKVADDVAAAAARRAINRAAAQVPDESAYDALRKRYEDMGALQYAVKPEGNINLQPVLRAEALRGPDVQPIEAFVAQAKNTPGVTQDALEEIVSGYKDISPGTKISKADFEARLPPSKFNKVDLRDESNDFPENDYFREEARDLVMENYDHVWERMIDVLGLSDFRSRSGEYNDVMEALNKYHNGEIGPRDLPKKLRSVMAREGLLEDREQFDSLVQGQIDELIDETAHQLMEDHGVLPDLVAGYLNFDRQRLIPGNIRDDLADNYFEFGVTHPGRAGMSYKHYPDYENKKEGLIGHVRGTFVPADKTGVTAIARGGNREFSVVPLKPNSMLIEEIQADSQKVNKQFEKAQTGPLRQVHGTLFKAAINDALEKGATTVYYPTADTVSLVRGNKPEQFVSIYDKQIVREGLNPLSKIPGVEIKPVQVPTYKNNVLGEPVTAYYEINFSPEAADYILKGPGQTTPGYAAGGLVTGYDPDAIARLAQQVTQGFAAGGLVTYDRDAIDALANKFKEEFNV